MRNSRGFALTAEAVLALLAAAAFILLLPPSVSRPPSEPLYAYQLANDLLETGVKSREAELARFADGDALARESLSAHYSALISHLGAYCLVLTAKSSELYAGCTEKTAKGFRQQAAAYRTMLDSQGNWFELKAELKY